MMDMFTENEWLKKWIQELIIENGELKNGYLREVSSEVEFNEPFEEGEI